MIQGVVADFVTAGSGLLPTLEFFLDGGGHHVECGLHAMAIQQRRASVHLAGPRIIEAETDRDASAFGHVNTGPACCATTREVPHASVTTIETSDRFISQPIPPVRLVHDGSAELVERG